MAVTTVKETQHTPFSEEDVAIVSKHDTSIIWAGAKVMYSGLPEGEPQAASGYNYASGEADIQPIGIGYSGWGQIRIPEINQLHKLFVFPKNPQMIARVAYQTLTVGVTSGYPSAEGGCSGKVALVQWQHICSGCGGAVSGNYALSGDFVFNSGLVDVIAFGSIY